MDPRLAKVNEMPITATTMIAFTSASIDNGPVYLGVNFVSFEGGRWVENRYVNIQVKN